MHCKQDFRHVSPDMTMKLTAETRTDLLAAVKDTAGRS